MSKRNTTTEAAHLAPLRSTAQVPALAKSVKGSPRTQTGNGRFFIADRDEGSLLTAVSKTLLGFLFCIQLDYFFNAFAGTTLLSYRQEQVSFRNSLPRGSRYSTGPWDAVFVVFYTIFILLIRKIITQRPRAVASYFGAKSPERFTEQLFSFVYFTSSTTFGLFIAQTRHTWSMNVHELIAEVETGSLDGNVKCFYLIQAAFWVQEALVVGLQLEKPREDYVQLIFHHVITLVAISLSYGGKYTDLGIMILVTHDASDAVLGAAKLLRYVRSGLTGLAWLIFLFTWLYTRHYLMIPVIYLTWQFSSELDSKGYSFLGKTSLFSGCLLVLIQMLNLYWLTFILRGFYRLLFSSGTTKDMRSDEEDEGDEQ
ncbi:Sphingosine N-acyltransferase lac1 [Cytospora mali]|uniref:Sphingosine N-acyltransferase lac1 n=1 Tax=Cytospora mali TaxID=578113 RepID=A0A194VT87_CYTMA|nr:Sphingosine N-acyltransferase lac1 [Valsa mali]